MTVVGWAQWGLGGCAHLLHTTLRYPIHQLYSLLHFVVVSTLLFASLLAARHVCLWIRRRRLWLGPRDGRLCGPGGGLVVLRLGRVDLERLRAVGQARGRRGVMV